MKWSLSMKKRIYFNLFIVSFVVMGLEMTATRFIAPSFGNTVYTWGIIISIFLIGSSIGYMVGGVIGDKSSSNKIMHFFYIFGIFTIALIPMIKELYLSLFRITNRYYRNHFWSYYFIFYSQFAIQ